MPRPGVPIAPSNKAGAGAVKSAEPIAFAWSWLFCRRHGMPLSTLNRHLKKQQNRQNQAGSNGVEQLRLVAVELATAVATVSAGESPGALTVLLSNGRRVEVGRGFDAATLAQLVTVLERL